MEGELSTTKLLTPAALSSMKRSQLQKLCKKYGLKANGKNTDLQEKLKEYALNSGENISTEDIEMMYTPDMYMSSQRNQYANSVSEPTTPQTPSVIPLEQQNRVRSSLVDDSPIKIETSQPSQHEFKEFEAEVVHENKCLSLIPYQGSLFFNLAEKQEENMTESKKDEMEDVNNIENVDYTRDITKSQITEHLVPDEKTNSNPISLNSAFEQVEINKPVMPNIFVSPLTPSSNVIPIEQRTSKEERENDVSVTVHKELETRVAVLKALPSPERKRILGLNNAKSEIPVATPFRKDSETSIIKQTSSSSANRFAKVHEKVFSQMPSIMTHYAAQKTKKVEETQDEVNRKRKDLDSMQPLVKKQKLAHSSLENQSIKAANNVYKKDKSVVKKTYEGNRTIKYSRSSVRLAKSTNVFPNQEERKKEREELEKRKQAARNEVLAKSKNVFPNQERKKELEKRKQTARSVIQPVLKTETKESVAKNSQNTQNIKIKKPRPSLLPRRVSQKKLSK